MTQPIVFTDAAVAHIKKMLHKNPRGVGFRLSVKKSGCSGLAYVPAIVEKITASDLQFNVTTDMQVFVDPEALQYLQDVVVDYVVDGVGVLKQERLTFINPKETGRCGCGESFTIE